MIATGLVFLLGALVATLVALLFIPLLWRNAQRLARRDMAATMPATMNEIRAEVDRVRAEAAVAVRRSEIQARKAQDRAARERGKVGRLTGDNAEALFLRDQHQAEANALRSQLADTQSRLEAEQEENATLQSENEELRASLQSLEDAIMVATDPLTDDAAAGTESDAPAAEADQKLVAVNAALTAILREGGRTAAKPEMGEDAGARAREEASATVSELNALADPARRPSDPEERERENSLVRAKLSTLAERILKVTGRSSAATPQAADDEPADAPAPAEIAASGGNDNSSPTRGAKRRRGGARSRRRSPH